MVFRHKPVATWPISTLVLALGAGLTWFAIFGAPALAGVTLPALVLLLVVLSIIAALRARTMRARENVRGLFGGSLPPKTLEHLARNPELLRRDGVARTVTYLSCGLRGFPHMAEAHGDDPAGFTRLVHRALAPLMDCVLQNEGIIDHRTAEGFSAYWNVPMEDPGHAERACAAAYAMTVAVAEVNRTLSREHRLDSAPAPLIEIGIGLATGPAIAGAIRADGRTDYVVHGDCTIAAERLRALSEHYGPAIVASAETQASAAGRFAFLEVDCLAADLHDEPMTVYAMLGNPMVRASPKFRALNTFHARIFQNLRAQQWKAARDLIEQCRKLSGASQKLYDLHLARIAYFEKNPPGEGWDGAFRPILK